MVLTKRRTRMPKRWRRKSKRLYDTQTVIDGIQATSQLRQHALEYAPNNLPQPVPTHEGYCTKCRDKKTFEVQEETPLKNGAVHRKGACPDCGTKMGAFAKGLADASA